MSRNNDLVEKNFSYFQYGINFFYLSIFLDNHQYFFFIFLFVSVYVHMCQYVFLFFKNISKIN